MNPEFRRNLWQELSLQRLIAMPTILLAVFSLAYLKDGFSALPHSTLSILFLLLVVWGAGLAADAVFGEIREHTWDAQRMTPLSPWSMAWGKLFGSTVFVWYGAIWCLAAAGWSVGQAPEVDLGAYSSIARKSIYYLLIGVFTQALGLFMALLFQRISPLRSRTRAVLIQLFAIAVGILFFIFGKNGIPNLFNVRSWYNLDITAEQFMLASAAFFCLSLLFGIYRLLRAELQIRSLPWAWALFVVVWIFYICGFSLPTQFAAEDLSVWKKSFYLAIAYFALLKGTFLSAFFTPKNIIQYFKWFQYLKESKYQRSLSLTPSWVITLLLAFLLIFPLLYTCHHLELVEHQGKMISAGLSLSAFFFLLRDLGLLYYITFDFQAKRAHLATIVYLSVLYTLVPMLLSFTELPPYWLPAFAPWAWFTQAAAITWMQIGAVVLLVFAQAGIAWSLVVIRWRDAANSFG